MTMTLRYSRRQMIAGSAAASATLGLGKLSTAQALARLARLQDAPVAIDYWHRSTGNAAAEWEKLAATFNEEMAGQIQVTAIAQGDIQELNQKIRAAASGGGLPGATMGDDYDITQYAANGIIVPIDPFLNDAENGLTAEEIGDFLPNQLNRHKLAIYDDQMMAFPQGFSAFTCFWNADALTAAGFDGPPATWQEFPDHVRAVAKANPGMTGWNIGGAGDRFISVLLTHGVQWLADDNQSSNFDRPETLEILTWWKALADEGLLAVIDGDDARNAFTSGKAAYYMDSSGNTADIGMAEPAFTWSCGLPPQGADNPTPITETYGPVNAIPKNDEAKQLAGWLWLKWLTTPGPLAEWVMASAYYPSRTSVGASPELAAYYDENPYAAKLLKEAAPLARIIEPHAALQEIRSQITADNVNEVLLGRLSPEDGMLKLTAEAEAALAAAG
jgi:ABC-type glycerol-3-phosphate transport system substrate-binding protein